MADNVPSYHPTLLVSGQMKKIQPRMISQDQIEQISQNLRNQISKSVKDIKVLSNEVTSESHDAELLEPSLSPQETPKKRGKKPTTKVVGEFSLSYEIPPICIQNNIDLDNVCHLLLLCDECASDPTKCQQFSFIERLQNWTLRLRERTKGKHCDVYFNHMMSGSLFRSKKEVVNFIIYEKYPSTPKTEKDKKKVEIVEVSTAATSNNELKEVSTAATSNNESLLGEKKQKCDEEIDQWAIDKERVEKFLAESYENLMNRDSRRRK